MAERDGVGVGVKGQDPIRWFGMADGGWWRVKVLDLGGGKVV